MPVKRQDLSNFEKTISLGQQISHEDKAIKQYVGADTDLARAIARITILKKYKVIPPRIAEFIISLLAEENKAVFWSSEKTDIFTKLSGYLPKAHARLSFGNPKRKNQRPLG